jgi:hypothetical protein
VVRIFVDLAVGSAASGAIHAASASANSRADAYRCSRFFDSALRQMVWRSTSMSTGTALNSGRIRRSSSKKSLGGAGASVTIFRRMLGTFDPLKGVVPVSIS